MDPFIETSGLWGDFHSRLISKISERLADATPERYLVRTQERSYLVLVGSEGKDSHPFLPDVSVTAPQKPGKSTGRKKAASATAVAERIDTEKPMALRAFIAEEHREGFIEIYEATPEHRLVTSIEVLSPSNKRTNTPGQDEYLRKRQSVMLDGVHLVEIDLLRAGERMPMLDPWPDSPYTLTVARARKGHVCDVWPAYFHRPLPAIPIPLLKPDADILVPLQAMIDEIYERFRYARSIDYTRSLTPPPGPEETFWLQQHLPARKG
jgi:hypothetical protein